MVTKKYQSQSYLNHLVYSQISFLSRYFIFFFEGGHLRFKKIYFPLVDVHYRGELS